MKIGIMTQPLYTNYGGIIQCYALQTTLRRMGHETVVLQREFNRKYSLKGACIYYAKHFAKLMLGRKSSWHYCVSQKKRDFIAQNTYKFIQENIITSKHCYSTEELRQEVENQNFDTIIVGSDQVWRPCYSPCQTNYFLDFLKDNSKIKRISYAASFGTDNWEFSDELTKVCGGLLRKFNAVSVREKSAISLCKEHFDVDATHVLDPTLLLDKDSYLKLINSSENKTKLLFSYVLDRNNEKNVIVENIARQTCLKTFEVMPELPDEIFNLYGDIDKCIYPPLEKWLAAFEEADMVITDSFHGTVFSIIFNKPFWVIANEGRGTARFKSLLSLFNLSNRLINKFSIDEINLNLPIDWCSVNNIKRNLQEESLRFIIKSISV